MSKSSNPTKDFYNANAAKWAAQKNNSFYHEAEFKTFVSKFKKGNTILDIGCANGIHVPLFLGIGRNLKYEGVDISRSFLKMASARYPQIHFGQTDLLDEKSFPRKKFDGFWAAAVLMHIPLPKWPQMLENIEKHMKSGAIGYITVPQERFADSVKDSRHFEVFTTKEFSELIETRKWRVLKSGNKGSTATNDWLWFLVQLP